MKTVKIKVAKVTRKKSVTGYVVYEGASQIDGKPIVGILTTKKSDNEKTGDMPQLWILPRDTDPNQATKTGEDSSVCGMCPHRHHLGGACYVTVFQAPLSVWRAYKRGSYATGDGWKSEVMGRKVRLGAYGDPFAIPQEILDEITDASMMGNTSYTHQWRENSDLKRVSMASADSLEEKREANQMGWRTFRVMAENESGEYQLDDDEIMCPNITRGISCAECGLCGGNQVKAKNIAIIVHGAKKKRFNEQLTEVN